MRTPVATNGFDSARRCCLQGCGDKSDDGKAVRYIASRVSRLARISRLEPARLLEILTFYRPEHTEECLPAQRLRKEQYGSTSLPLNSLPSSDHRCGLRRLASDGPKNSVHLPTPDPDSIDYIYIAGRRSCAWSDRCLRIAVRSSEVRMT